MFTNFKTCHLLLTLNYYVFFQLHASTQTKIRLTSVMGNKDNCGNQKLRPFHICMSTVIWFVRSCIIVILLLILLVA